VFGVESSGAGPIGLPKVRLRGTAAADDSVVLGGGWKENGES
jgi:hypothetical protein